MLRLGSVRTILGGDGEVVDRGVMAGRAVI